MSEGGSGHSGGWREFERIAALALAGGGALIGAIYGFAAHGIGGALVFGFIGFLVGGAAFAVIPYVVVWGGIVLVLAGALLALIGIAWVVTKLWDVGI